MQIGGSIKDCSNQCQKFCLLHDSCNWEDSDDNVGTITDTGDHEPFP